MILTLTTATALAHTALEYPQPRYPSDGSTANKACPCGVGDSNRLCDVPADRSDPDRALDRVTTFNPGETIIVQFYETIGHAGRYRIAFDIEGADLSDFDEQVLLDVPDPAGNEGNVGQGSLWEFEVTLPNTPCDNCTLQLIQMMDGNTDDPVLDPVGRSSYYQCADLVLAGEPVGGDTDEPVEGAAEGQCGCSGSGTQALPLFGAFLLFRRRRGQSCGAWSFRITRDVHRWAVGTDALSRPDSAGRDRALRLLLKLPQPP